MTEPAAKQDCKAAYAGQRYPEFHGVRCTKQHWQHSTHWHAAWVNEVTKNEDVEDDQQKPRFRLTWRDE